MQHRDVRVPSFLYGTAWKEEQTEALVKLALGAGFTGIDTANQRKHYFEAAVGAGITAVLDQGALTREDLFLQTKFTYVRGQDHRLPYDPKADYTTQVQQSFASSLEHLHVSYLDSYVLHGPSMRLRLSDVDWEVWNAMGALQTEGKTRLIGVSNVDLEQLVALQRDAEVKPAFVQNRCFARDGWDSELRAFCRAHDIIYQGFSLLTANDRELRRPAIADIVQRTKRTLPQVVFRFAQQVGMLPLTGTTNETHMKDDLSVDGFTLSDEDITTIERVAT
jgi:diketogulonate reductase-like aldo/keto reductase